MLQNCRQERFIVQYKPVEIFLSMCEQIQDAAKAAAAARGKQTYSGYSSEEEEEEELTVEEQQAMEMENERLVEQLSSLTSQVGWSEKHKCRFL